MITAILDGKVVIASRELPLASKLKPPLKYLCRNPFCKHPELILRKGPIKQPHFAHKRKNFNCEQTWENETKEHIKMKQVMQEFLGIPDEDVECYGYEGVRPDLIWRTPEKIFAVEVQHSRISEDEITRRNSLYKEFGLEPLWIFHREFFCGKYEQDFLWTEKDLWKRSRKKKSIIRQVFALALNDEPRIYCYFGNKYRYEKKLMESKEELLDYINQPELFYREKFLDWRNSGPPNELVANLLSDEVKKGRIINYEAFPLQFSDCIPDFLWKNKNQEQFALFIIASERHIPSPDEFERKNIHIIVLWQINEIHKALEVDDKFNYQLIWRRDHINAKLFIYNNSIEKEIPSLEFLEFLILNPTTMIRSMYKAENKNSHDHKFQNCFDCKHLTSDYFCNYTNIQMELMESPNTDPPLLFWEKNQLLFFKSFYYVKKGREKRWVRHIPVKDAETSRFLEIDKQHYPRLKKGRFIACDYFDSDGIVLKEKQPSCKWCGSNQDLNLDTRFYTNYIIKFSNLEDTPMFLCKKCFEKYKQNKELCHRCKKRFHESKYPCCWFCFTLN